MYKKSFKHKLMSGLLIGAITLSIFAFSDTVSAASIKVKRGDTISLIAKKYNVSSSELLKKNNIKNANKIRIGQVLVLPAKKTTPKKAVVKKTTAKKVSKVVRVSASAYSRQQKGMSNFTARGIDLRKTSNVIAVDPKVIKLGSKVYVPGYGEAIAGDTGGWIKGNKIDIHFNTVNKCYNWGRRSVNVTVYK
ncbi:3D domain-containing protein [Brochothrix campestris]|uniref:3D domain-containing protein n=1 Tax=Brochothrix campestris TaxID=2757 RepID=UPI0038CF8350